MRIYISATTLDLARHRQAVITQLLKAHHTPVCMEHHAASDVVPLDECLREVASCEAYVGIFGWRYGFIPPSMKKSITEMEYRKAVEIGIPTFVFLLDENADYPAEFRDSGSCGEQIQALRLELQSTHWVAFFTNPENLAMEVVTAVHVLVLEKITRAFKDAVNATPRDRKIQQADLKKALDEERRRQRQRERVPVPVPDKLTRHFQDRDAEIAELRRALSNRDLRLILICGRGGVGKTTLAAKLIQELGQERSEEYSSVAGSVEGIVYVSLGEPGFRTPDRIVEMLGRTLEPESSEDLKHIWSQPGLSLRERLAELFRGPLARRRSLIILDNMESVMDGENRISEEFIALRRFVDAFLEYDHHILLVVASRRVLAFSPDAEIAASGKTVRIALDGGLPEDFAVALLRQLDSDGLRGLRTAPDKTLRRIARRCQCLPRTLEAVFSTLVQHPTWTLETLVADESLLSRLVENPARELYLSLSSDPERLVMQVLAVYGKPVPSAAVRAVLPALPIDEILDMFVRNFVAGFAHGRFWLHPLDRDYAYQQIPDTGSEYSKPVLHGMAARYFLCFPCPPRKSRTSLEDVTPRLDAIEHLLAAGEDEDAARWLLEDGLLEDLHWQGHFLLLDDLGRRVLGRKISARRRIPIQIQLGKVERNLGRLEEAKAIYESALPLVGEAADPEVEIGLLNALGDIHYFLSDVTGAEAYLRRAEEMLASHPNPLLQSENSGDLANVLLSCGDFENAKRLYEQSIAFSRDAGNQIYEGIWNGNLGNLYDALFQASGKPEDRERAVAAYRRAIAIARDANDLRHVSHWNGALGNLYRRSKDFDTAETHLREALAISRRIHYGRGLPVQIQWLAAVVDDRVRAAAQTGDRESVFRTCLASCRLIQEIGLAELQSLISPRLDGYVEILINQLADEGLTDDALAWGREYLGAAPVSTARDILFGSIGMRLGMRTGRPDAFLFSAEVHSRALRSDAGEMQADLFESRATAYARAGKIYEALEDYAEAMKHKVRPVDAALSRAEVLIWAGRYGEAKAALDALRPQLESDAEKIIYTWLTAHALNLSGGDCAAEIKALEDAGGRSIPVTYEVRDIETYLRGLDQAKIESQQIRRAWQLQAMIIKIATPSAAKPS